MFDVINSTLEKVCPKNQRLVQICSPTLEPFQIIKVESDSDLGITTRGSGGFGSTGASL